MKKVLSLVISAVMILTMFFTSSTVSFADEWRYGIDVSHNNEVLNFSDSVFEEKPFVMIRLGYYNHLDRNFWENVKAVCEADIDFGVYLYSYAESVEEAKIEARFVIETLSQLGDYAKNFTLPVAYDMEDSKIAVYGKTQLTNQMKTFLDIIKSAGYTPMIYANSNWFNNYIDLNVAKNYKIWYANYNGSIPSEVERIKIKNTDVYADMWQYCEGKNGTLDQNVIYNPADLIKPVTCAHIYQKVSTTESTCTVEGKEQWKCSECAKTFNISIPKCPHSIVVDKAKSATYFATGKTKGEHCSKCKKVITAQKKTDKKKPKIKSVATKKKEATVKWDKISEAKGYQIQYSTSKSFTQKTTNSKSVSGNKTKSVKITKLKSKKKYYFRLRAYKTVNGKKTYSVWSATKSIKIK